MRKAFTAAIAMILLISTVGCGSETVNTSTSQPTGAGELKEVTYWVEMNGPSVSAIDSYSEIEYLKELEQRTGVKVKFLHPPVGQAAEQFKLLIASRNDLPDIIEATWTLSYPGVQKRQSRMVLFFL